MSKYSLLKEEEGHFTLHDGKAEFSVAKQAIDGALADRIRGLPKYAMGGVVEDTAPVLEEEKPSWLAGGFMNPSDPEAEYKKAELAKALAGGQGGPAPLAAKPYGLPEGPKPASTEAPVVAEGATTDPVALAEATKSPVAEAQKAGYDPMKEMNSAYGMQERGIKDMATAQADLAKAQEGILNTAYNPEKEKAAQEKLQRLEVQAQTLDAENEQIFKAAAENKIDPNRYMASMSTGNKIMAVIGLMFGGAGSGGQADNNAAANMLNKAIDNDIKAQVANKDQQNSLYQMNLQKYRDVNSAISATKMEMNAFTQGKIAAAVAKSGSQQAQAQGQIMIGKLKEEQAAQKAALMKQQAAQSMFVGSDPIAAKIQLMPENVRQEAWKELGEYRSIESNLKQVPLVLREAAESTKLGKNITSPIQSKRMREIAFSRLFPIAKAIAGERMTDADARMLIEPNLPGLTDSEETIKKKEQAMMKALMAQVSGRTPRLSAFGLIPNQDKIDFKPRK